MVKNSKKLKMVILVPDLLPDPFGGDNDPFVDLYNNLGPLADPSSPFPAPQPPQQQLQPTPVHHNQPPQVKWVASFNPLKKIFPESSIIKWSVTGTIMVFDSLL